LAAPRSARRGAATCGSRTPNPFRKSTRRSSGSATSYRVFRGSRTAVAPAVRRATDADVPDVVALFLDYLRFYGVPADAARAGEFIAARIARGESAIFLAFDDGSPAGFAQLYPGFSSLDQARQWTLEDLFVDPRARRRGVARALLTAAEELARETGAVRLTLATARTNEIAQRLYESAGWVRDEAFFVYTRSLENS
jgi:ribosomal protein S18 acetylase RimI-like enzyme